MGDKVCREGQLGGDQACKRGQLLVTRPAGDRSWVGPGWQGMTVRRDWASRGG